MKNSIKLVLSFAFGVGCGLFGYYLVTKKKFEERLQFEIDSIKKVYQKKDLQTKARYSANKPTIDEVVEAVNPPVITKEDKENYINYTKYYKNDEEEGSTEIKSVPVVEKPYVITPEDFGSMDYTEISLTLFKDGILVEEGEDEPLPIDETIGNESLEHIGDYAHDAVYVRNESLGIDYEVIRSGYTYEESTGKPNPNSEE